VLTVEDIVLSATGPAPQTECEYKPGAKVEVAFSKNAESLVGIKGRILADETSGSYYPSSTLGGAILVGDTFYALSTAHSLFRKASIPTPQAPRRLSSLGSSITPLFLRISLLPISPLNVL
jgi:hypothetical protein